MPIILPIIAINGQIIKANVDIIWKIRYTRFIPMPLKISPIEAKTNGNRIQITVKII